MPDIYISDASHDGTIVKSGANHAAARDASSGTADTNNASDGDAIEYVKTSRTTSIRRAFFKFDTSGVTNSPASATLKIYGISNDSADIIVVASDAFTNSGALQDSDFNNLDFNTPYSSQISTWSTSGYNDIALNIAGRQQMATADDFIIAVIEHDYDYSDSAPVGATQTSETGVYFTDQSGTDKDPYIEYSNIGDLLGTDFTTISTVSGVEVANIGKVIGVE